MKVPQAGRAVAARFDHVEESPHSEEHGTVETTGWRDLPDRATETNSPLAGDGEKVV